MFSEEYFDQMVLCDNDSDVLAQLMTHAGISVSSQNLMRVGGDVRFNLRTLLAESFSSLERETVLGKRGATVLKLLHVLILKYQREKLHARDIISNILDLNQYLTLKLSCLRDEHIFLLLLDAKNQLISEHKIASGTPNKVIFYPGVIIRTAIEGSASAIIVVHNHPSGDPEPSQLDITMSLELQHVCTKLEITMHDHIIVGCDRVLSMRARGFLDPLTSKTAIRHNFARN